MLLQKEPSSAHLGPFYQWLMALLCCLQEKVKRRCSVCVRWQVGFATHNPRITAIKLTHEGHAESRASVGLLQWLLLLWHCRHSPACCRRWWESASWRSLCGAHARYRGNRCYLCVGHKCGLHPIAIPPGASSQMGRGALVKGVRAVGCHGSAGALSARSASNGFFLQGITLFERVVTGS